MSEFTDQQILDEIPHALAEGKMETVVSLIHLLALQSPDKAAEILEGIQLGFALRRGDS
jgi:hypothetical protein